MIKRGLCCIHMGLQARGIRFQTMTWKQFSSRPRKDSIEILSKRYENNLRVIHSILRLCIVPDWNYRVSSDIFPLMTHPESKIVWDELPNVETLNQLFRICAEEAFFNSTRLSCHPDQFNVLASENDKAVEQTITELNHHGWFMSKLGLDPSTCQDPILRKLLGDTKGLHNFGYVAPINIHLNCSKGDPKDITKRFKANLDRLNDDAKKRLVVEVEDKGIWTAKMLVDHIHEATGVPVTFDYLHHKCNPGGLTEEEAFKLCAETWGSATPLFHFAETLPGQNNPRKHADFPTFVPNDYGYNIDLDYEFKMKDQALQKAQKLEEELESKSVGV